MVIIDRFEEDMAVLETEGGMLTVPRDTLPAEASEGDVLVRDGNGWTADKKAAAARRSAIRKKLRRLTERQD